MRPIASLPAALRTVAGALVLLLMMAQVVVVALRYVFSIGRPWALDLLVYCFFLIALLPLLFVLARNVSVRVDVLNSRWSERRKRGVDRLALLVLLVPAMAYACWASLAVTHASWRVLESSPTYGGLPGYFVLKATLSLSFLALAVVALVMGLRRAPYAAGERDEP